MKILLALPVAVRAILLAFVAGLVVGIPLGYQAGVPDPASTSVETGWQIPRVAEEVKQPCTPTSSS